MCGCWRWSRRWSKQVRGVRGGEKEGRGRGEGEGGAATAQKQVTKPMAAGDGAQACRTCRCRCLVTRTMRRGRGCHIASRYMVRPWGGQCFSGDSSVTGTIAD